MNERLRPFGITIVENAQIERIWPHVTPLLLKGEKYWRDYYTLENIKEFCISGSFQLWIGIDRNVNAKKIVLILLTSLSTYPQSIWLRYVYMGGQQMKDAVYYRPQIQSWARAHGAIGEEIYGRFGWLKYMPDANKPRYKFISLSKKFGE